MSKMRVIVLSVVHQGLSKKQAAAKYQVSVRWVEKLLKRHREQGLDGLAPKSRRPRTSPKAVTSEVMQDVLDTRYELVQAGFDAGPHSIKWHIESVGGYAPSPSSIRRILLRAGAIEPQPRKRPRTSYIRFQADQPNQTWQSDFTHWQLADGTDIEILNFLDDHSRFLLGCKAYKPVTGQDVIDLFIDCISQYGPPQSTLTDNGAVFTARFRGGKNVFEYTLANLGIEQKNGSPGHPQTQGKIERFHQTLKRFLVQKPKAQSIEELQVQLDEFRKRYNFERPHRALNQNTPHHAYVSTIKAIPGTGSLLEAFRVRHDKVDESGKVTLRRSGKLHKLGIGRAHAQIKVLILVDNEAVTVTSMQTGEVLAEFEIQPEKKYWAKRTNPPSGPKA